MTPQSIHGLFQEAVDAGCDDPLVRYIQARMVAQLPKADPDTVLRAGSELGRRPDGEPVPADADRAGHGARRGFPVDLRAPGPARAKRANDWLRTSLDELVHSAKTDRRTPEMESEWYRWAQLVTEAYRDGGDSFEEAEEKVEQALAKTPVLEATLHTLRGEAAIGAAWRARGSGGASTVNEEGWRIFQEKLTEARREFEAAADAQPGEVDPADPAHHCQHGARRRPRGDGEVVHPSDGGRRRQPHGLLHEARVVGAPSGTVPRRT